MRYIRTQAILALIGLAVVGGLLYTQSQGLVTTVVPAQGGTLTEAVVGQPRRLNPLFDRNSPADRDLDRLIFSGLMKFDADGLPVPDLAESWAVSADGLTYTFVLKDGLTWHDGEPVTQQDVLFTIGLLQAPDFPGAGDVASLWQKVTVSSPARNTVRFVLPEPFAPFMDYVTVGLLPEHLLRGVSASSLLNHAFNFQPVGAGPMKLVSLDRQNSSITSVVLEPSPRYPGKAPYLSQLRFRFYPTAQAAYEAYLAGEVQTLSDFTPETFAAALKNPQLEIFSSRLPEYSLIFLNQKNETVSFFQEKRVRQALLAGLNRQLMVDTILQGQAFVAAGPILPGTWAYNDNLIPVKFDPAHAAQLLNDAGWALPPEAAPGSPDYVRSKSGKQLIFSLLVPPDATHSAVAGMAVKEWADLGVKVTIEPLPPDDIKTALTNRTFQAALVDLSFAATPDPDPYPFWHQTQIESGQNFSGYDNRDMSEILEQARTIPSYKDRAKFYRAFQSKFADQTPALMLYYPIFNYAVDRKVSGVQLGPLVDRSDRFNSLANWYIVTRRVIEEAP
ncbi:MAG: peptide ABC transporter substrate-binding protein [Chloroflexi bacterium]|nr:peptide ABC transporter substrate-binding protein [Chloroflexota bacterium]